MKRHGSYNYPNPYQIISMGYKTPCWIWQYALINGYGTRSLSRTERVYAHKYFYEKAKGSVPEGFDLDHLCNIKSCVNPDHLDLVTRSENMKRYFKRLNKK